MMVSSCPAAGSPKSVPAVVADPPTQARKSRSQSVPGRHEAVALATLAAQAARQQIGGLNWDPEPSPQSQSFSEIHGSILPTSLAYIVPSTRGCSPWRPDAVMKCDRAWRLSVLGFSRAPGMHGHHAASAICTDGRSAGLALLGFAATARPPTHRGLALAPTAGIGRALQRHPFSGLVDSAGSANQLPYALRVYSPVGSHTCQTPWSVFQGGSNGSPQAAPERADARRAVARAAEPRLRQRRLPRRSESRA
ncbi:hypothetical protein Bca4012_102617 [Brassica carinata]